MLNLSRYRILAIGKIRKEWILKGVATYLKRLPGLTIVELRDGNLKKEYEAINAALMHNEILITLTEEGENLTSTAFAKRLQELASQRLVFVIGGADGLPPKIKALAKWNLSLSPLTFPHEIARLLLLEQIYRANTIIQKGPYHRK